MTAPPARAASLAGITHRYGRTAALDDVSIDFPVGRMTGLIGPDGVGKSTLLALVAGARRIQQGRVVTLDHDMGRRRERAAALPRIAYMPQGLGKNLYMDLSILENLHFFGRLFGQPRAERAARIDRLLRATALEPFAERPAGKLSGGMKQKLGLCCALIHDPDLLILDEPTTGIDPLSRHQFWNLIAGLRANHPGMSVVVATAYAQEAERFDWLVAMRAGKILAAAPPAELKARVGAGTLEEAFVKLLPEDERRGFRVFAPSPRPPAPDSEPAIVARDLTRTFDGFVAVDKVSFTIGRGEIFGFLGSNGCGKTTTMKMLTGLLPATAGEAQLFGRPAQAHDLETRKRVGYMSQSFSLYTELTVRQNLVLHAHLFHLPPETVAARVGELMAEFGLATYAENLAEKLPLGVRQRLSLAVALIHQPEMLILDEPTSGVDPLARDRFWGHLIDLSRNHGVTIFISTHFMSEGERCDRVSLMHAGRVLASGTPAELIRASNSESLEGAFIACLGRATGVDSESGAPRDGAFAPVPDAGRGKGPGGLPARFNPRRLWAYSLRESLELWRDPIRLAFALFGTVLLMLVFGFGITFDVERLNYAALDRDRTPQSRAYLEGFSGSRYFRERPPLGDQADMHRRLTSGNITLALEIPPGFGRDLLRGREPEIAAWIDGAMPFRGETAAGYVAGVHQSYLADLSLRTHGALAPPPPADIEPRYRYNQAFQSVFAVVPINIALLLIFIPAILAALGVVREKELGSIVNFHVTPVTRVEFLIGKQLPYIAVGMINFLVMTAIAIVVFGVPVKGSFPALAFGALLYVTATTAFGLVISAFTRTQIAALFGTAIASVVPAIQFSGMMQPVSSLEGFGAVIGQIFPTTHFITISVGIYTKGLTFFELGASYAALAACVAALTAASVGLMRGQER